MIRSWYVPAPLDSLFSYSCVLWLGQFNEFYPDILAMRPEASRATTHSFVILTWVWFSCGGYSNNTRVYSTRCVTLFSTPLSSTPGSIVAHRAGQGVSCSSVDLPATSSLYSLIFAPRADGVGVQYILRLMCPVLSLVGSCARCLIITLLIWLAVQLF
jgi:hypothetical protein